jgi:crotonobetaine/carnitine-CoA ligase
MCLRPLLPGLFLQEYLGKPVATVEAFRNLWFHTGDAAYCDDAGAFYFVDRPGDRIRARGEDVTSFQMEDLVNSSPDVEARRFRSARPRGTRTMSSSSSFPVPGWS